MAPAGAAAALAGEPSSAPSPSPSSSDPLGPLSAELVAALAAIPHIARTYRNHNEAILESFRRRM